MCCSESVFLQAVSSIQGLKGQGFCGLCVNVAMGQPRLPCMWVCCLCHVWPCMWSVCALLGSIPVSRYLKGVLEGSKNIAGVPQEF